jgi:error-prone DNA polymerase
MTVLIAGRTQPYSTVTSLQDAGLSAACLEKLADADAFRSMGLDRRQALWEVAALADRPIGLFKGTASESACETGIALPEMRLSEHVIQDYATTSLSLKAHPVQFIRDRLHNLGAISAAELMSQRNGQFVKVAGLVLVRQRPGTASGVCFITLEDETGNFNLIVWPSLFEEYRKEILGAKVLMAEGHLQIEKEVVHVIVQRCHNLNRLLAGMTPLQEDAVEVGPRGGQAPLAVGEVKQASLFPEARNFK